MKDMRCVICKQPHSQDSLQHLLGYQCQQCPQVAAAASRIQLDFHTVALTGDHSKDSSIVLFASALLKAHIDFQSVPFGDENGSHIYAWFQHYKDSNAPAKKIRKIRKRV